ncbi:MAG TPA: hypothetical protein DDW52_11945, partial [Planctomycetaceae bacterium]|nr:hypothetical protein [Planctomycetaceae bacterium]
ATTLVLGRLSLNSEVNQPAEHTAVVWTASSNPTKIPFLTHAGQVGRLSLSPSAEAPASLYLGPVNRCQYRLSNRPELLEKSSFPRHLTGITFRYLGTSAWRDTWNSHSLGLPRAVEVTLRQSRGAPITLNIAITNNRLRGVR